MNVDNVYTPSVKTQGMSDDADSSTQIPLREWSVTAQVKALRERAGLSMEQVARGLGLAGASSYQRYENPTLFTKPFIPLDLARKLLFLFKDRGKPPIRPADVLRLAGLGMELARAGASPAELDAATLEQAFRDDGSYHRPLEVPEILRRVPADDGFVEVPDDRMTWGFPKTWLRILPLIDAHGLPADHDRLEVMSAPDDSMSGTIERHDKLLIYKLAGGFTSPWPGFTAGVYAIWDGANTLIKRLELRQTPQGQVIRVISDNQRYSSYDVSANSLIIIGKVIARTHIVP